MREQFCKSAAAVLRMTKATTELLGLRLAPNKLPDELLATDRIMLRWAASVGDGMTDPAWTELVRCRVPELSWDVAIIVDQLIMRSQPTTYREVVTLWYRKPDPREVIAHKLGLREDEVRIVHECSLRYFRRHFETSQNSELRRISELTVRERAGWVRDRLSIRSEISDFVC